jgi:hypothetical protein
MCGTSPPLSVQPGKLAEILELAIGTAGVLGRSEAVGSSRQLAIWLIWRAVANATPSRAAARVDVGTWGRGDRNITSSRDDFGAIPDLRGPRLINEEGSLTLSSLALSSPRCADHRQRLAAYLMAAPVSSMP